MADVFGMVVGSRKDPSHQPFFRIARVHFVAEEAPEDSLSEGTEFELYEGKKCVARGQIESLVTS